MVIVIASKLLGGLWVLGIGDYDWVYWGVSGVCLWCGFECNL